MNSEQPATSPANREARFVHGVIEQCQRDKGLAARLRRANNPATEYQSWELLARYGIDLERDDERLPFASVAAAIAKAKIQSNGSLTLGRAVASCYPEGHQNDQAQARLRRLLACDEVAELCRVLRPVLTLIDSRVPQPLDYARLLGQLRRFAFAPPSVKAQWAQEFYGHKTAAEEQA
jgi:CRISPR system Cascade subunit CasB